MTTGYTAEDANFHQMKSEEKTETIQKTTAFPQHRHLAPGESFLNLYPATAKNTGKISNKDEKVLPSTQETFSCHICGREFAKKSGRTLHLKSCKKSLSKPIDEDNIVASTDKKLTSKDKPIVKKVASQQSKTTRQRESDRSFQASAPSLLEQPQVWGLHTIQDLSQIINATYNETTKWRKNLFNIPSGATGKRFVEEMTKLINNWNNKSPLANVALKALFIMPALLLQKPFKTSKSKDHVKSLERRLELWAEGDFDELIRECRVIQERLQNSTANKIASITKRFSDLM